MAKETATALKTSTKDTYDKATTGTVALELAARGAWTGKVNLAKGTAAAVKAEFDAVMLARKTAEASAVAYATAVGNYDGAIKL